LDDPETGICLKLKRILEKLSVRVGRVFKSFRIGSNGRAFDDCDEISGSKTNTVFTT
jgi:hypothetical protein